MGKRTETQLEKLKFGSQGWNEVLSANMQKLNDILLRIDGLVDVDITGLKDGDVLWWNATNQKFENVPKAYAISAASVSSASSESSLESSDSSESSESSVSSLKISESSSSESSESSESSFSCGNMGTDNTSGETFDASNYYSTYTPSKAFDDNNSTSWIVDAPGGWEWIEVLYTTDKANHKLRVRSGNIGWANTPTQIVLKASSSGEFIGEEVILLSLSGLSWTQDEWKEWEFENVSADKRWWRLYVSGTTPQYNIAEIELMECLDYSISSSSSNSSYSSESSFSSSDSSSSSLSACGAGWSSVLNNRPGQNYDAFQNGSDAWKIFDQVTTTGWSSNITPSSPRWVEIQFEHALRIRRYLRRNASYDNNLYAPRRFELKASNTGAFSGEEVTLHDTGVIAWAENETQLFEFSNDTDYIYYRFYLYSPLNSSYYKLFHINMYECLDDYSSSSISSESSYSSESIP